MCDTSQLVAVLRKEKAPLHLKMEDMISKIKKYSTLNSILIIIK